MTATDTAHSRAVAVLLTVLATITTVAAGITLSRVLPPLLEWAAHGGWYDTPLGDLIALAVETAVAMAAAPAAARRWSP